MTAVIYELSGEGRAGLVTTGPPRLLAVSRPVVVRLKAEIIGSEPAEPPGFQGNNTVEMLSASDDGGAGAHTRGDAGADVDISDRSPNAGGTTTFTVRAENEGRNYGPVEARGAQYYHVQLGVRVKIELSPGLTFAGTPTAPSGTSYSATNTTTGIWDVGTLEDGEVNARSLPVAVNLTSTSLDDLPLEKRCLTAEVISAVPWFGDHSSNRENDITTACLGELPKLPPLTQGEFILFNIHDCVGITSYPCTSADTVEILAIPRGFLAERQVARGVGFGGPRTLLKPEQITVHVRDPASRVYDRLATSLTDRSTVSWNTGREEIYSVYGVEVKYTRSGFNDQIADWSNFVRTVTVSGLNGAAAPGRVRVRVDNSTGFTFYDPNPTHRRTPFSLTSSSALISSYFLEFTMLGTYLVEFKVEALHNGGTTSGANHEDDDVTYTGSGTYTFHVGPIAELEVRDAGTNPAVADDRQAYTVMAVNNGPDAAPAVRVTGLPTGVTEYIASEGEYDPDSGVWTIGKLEVGDAYHRSGHADEGPALTLITVDAAGTETTAAIENTQDYSVVIDGTTHSTKYYDYIDDNNSATIEARAGTGAGHPDAPGGLRVVETPVANIVTWEAVETVNGHGVTHYQVQRSASPWTTVAEEAKGTVYADMGDGVASASYRVRAVNVFDVPGPWSQQATPHLKPGRPNSFTAAGQSDTQAGLSWDAPDTVAGVTVSGYDLEFSKDRGVTWTPLTGMPTQSGTTWTLTHTDATLTAASLTPDILRQYRLRTVGAVEGSTVKSDWATATLTHPKPGAPGSFTATGESETQATLSWSAPAAVTHVDVTGYELDFSQDGGVSWDPLTGSPTDSGTTTLTHTDSNLAADAARQYRARAVGAVGSVRVESGYAYALATENYPSPGAPRDFAANAASDTEVTLTWNAPEAVADVNLTGYELEVSIDRGVTWTSVADQSTLDSGATTHTHNDAANPLSSKPRQYRLKAVGTVGGSTYESGWVFAVPAGEVGPPQNLAATADGRNRIDLSWDQPAFGAEAVTGYRIDYTPAGPETWATVEHGYRTSPRSYQHTRLRSGDKLKPGQEYCYRVAATYAGGTGSFGARACATTEAVPEGSLPGEPENLRFAQVGRDYVTLEWDPPSAGGKVEYYKWRSNIHEPKKVTPETATRVTVRGLAPSWSYGFQVLAGNDSDGDGRWSREIQVTLNLAGGAVKTSPLDLEVDKGGSGSFNVALNRAPQWPLMLYLSFEGPACLTESLPYQQGKILLPTNPSYPSKEFWEDPWWGPPEDRLARPWNRGLDILVNASGCQGGETAVVDYDLTSLPFSYLEGLPMWEELGLDQDEWRDKWGTDRLDGISGPSVKVTVSDGGNIGGQQGSPGAAGQPTAVTLALDPASVSESAGQATLTATLDGPAPEGGIGGFLFAGADGTASQDIDFTMPLEIFIPGGQRSATAAVSITGDDVDEADETVALSALFDLGTALLEDEITLTITDDDTAGVRASAASGLAVDEDGTASYTVVLDSQPTADVTVTPTSDDPGAATVSPASHVFTPSGWNTPATFTVSGQVDEDTDDESVGISHWITSDDWRYVIVPVATVPVSVSDTTPEQQQQGPPNQAPTLAAEIADATIVNESGSHQVSLNGVFDDGDGDAATITASSSDTLRATVAVASDHSSLTVTAQARGTATITVTANDGRGGTVSDEFTVTVKAAPVVASAISDVSLEEGGSQDISLSGVFRDADGDALTLSAASSDDTVVSAFVFHDTLTIVGVSAGSATITVTAQDADGNRVSDSFDVSVAAAPLPVDNLRCVAEAERVVFLWDAPEWSGGETYAYDYELTLPDGRTEAGRLIGLTLLRRPGEYQAGSEASFNVKTVYELADGSHVSSADATLTCTVAE